MQASKELIGLLPAGGRATRLGLLPCSKEIYPVGFESIGPGGGLFPKVAATGLLESMRLAGARRAFFILRDGKWDIPGYYANRKLDGIRLAYVMMDAPYGAPHTLDQAYPFVKDATILFGFPDILFRPRDAFVSLLDCKKQKSASIVLGIYKAANPSKMDMLAIDDSGKVQKIVIKPDATALTHTWILAVWDGRFSRFLHEYVKEDRQRRLSSSADSDKTELHLGHVIQAAIEENWVVESVFFETGRYLDVGTPEDMQKAVSDNSWMAST